jgi:hypothetical protein
VSDQPTKQTKIGDTYSSIERIIAIGESTKRLAKAMEIPNFANLHIANVLRESERTREITEAALRAIPTPAERNEFQSAAVLMRAISDEAVKWKKSLPEGHRPAIMAFLHGGIQINVQALSQVSFHGIKVEGTLNGVPCSLLAHQSTIQLLCFAEAEKVDMPSNPIGFIWDGGSISV